MHEEFDLVLNVEFDRARKLKRPLSALVAMRTDIGNAPLTSQHLEEANACIGRCTRTYDAADLVTDSVIVVVLPETDPGGVRVVANRMRADFAAHHAGQRRWAILEFADIQRFGSPERFLEAARRVRPAAEIVGAA